MKSIFFSLTFLIGFSALAQNHQYVYRNTADSAFNCYLKVFPKTKTIRGLVIRDYDELPDMRTKSRFKLTTYCIDSGLMVMYTVCSKFSPELFYSDSAIEILDGMVGEVVKAHKIPANHIFIGGVSASGTRALRYAEYCAQGKSTSGIKIKAVFSVDSPLDLARFYWSVFTHKTNFKAGMLGEAEMMEKIFPQKLGGSPEQFPDIYRDRSVFSHADSTGGNAKWLKSTPIILFHEPDIDWWINERGSSFYDINSYDIAAFVIKLRALGNQDVELITTTGKGFDYEGKRNCHSWTIVDEAFLARWILAKME